MRYNNLKRLLVIVIPLALLAAFPDMSWAEATAARTNDTLTVEELAHLARLEARYFQGVREEAVKMIGTFFDTHTIIQTFTPQVRIIRQRKGGELREILRYLSSLRLEQEFITFYVNMLREEVVDQAVDAMLRKSQSFRR